MSEKSILVTGGAGELGSRLCEKLLAEGHSVICIDNLCTGRKENVFHLMKNAKFEFIRKDISEPFLIQADEVYHLAYPESADYRRMYSIGVTRTAFLGTLHVLEVAKRQKCKFCYVPLSLIPYAEIQRDSELERYYTDQKIMEHLIKEYNGKYGVEVETINY